ncbi:MAG: hypothetical protein IPI60_04330 [Saprospiraceae bacterium]|nr:hypothetical protein [Saprospiraceae bacterium]
MKCLNCGTSVSTTDTNCPSCRISLQKHGVIREITEATKSHHSCQNCGTSVSSTDTNCPTCQMPAPGRKNTPTPSERQSESGYPKSDPLPGFNNGISAYKKEGFIWNTIAHVEKNFNPVFLHSHLNPES